MSYMFNDCTSLKSIDLSSFNIITAVDMKAMFLRCFSLKKENIKINKNDEYLLNDNNLFG